MFFPSSAKQELNFESNFTVQRISFFAFFFGFIFLSQYDPFPKFSRPKHVRRQQKHTYWKNINRHCWLLAILLTRQKVDNMEEIVVKEKVVSCWTVRIAYKRQAIFSLFFSVETKNSVVIERRKARAGRTPPSRQAARKHQCNNPEEAGVVLGISLSKS